MHSQLAHAASKATSQRVTPSATSNRLKSNVVVGRQPGRAARGRSGLRGYDLVLSSGFLAFASHCGFLAAVDEVGLPVNAVMGTSAGALTGSLYCAGFSPTQVAEIFSCTKPIKRLRPCYQPWSGGLLSMRAVMEELGDLLPARFEDLERPLGVGVASASGKHVLVDSGTLPEPVAASAAIPYVFAPVDIPGLTGGPFMDGGVHCRIGLQLWRQQKYVRSGIAVPAAVVHLINRSSPFSGNDDTKDFDRQNAVVIKAPKSGKNFWDLGNFDAEFEDSRRRALPVLRQLMEQQAELGDDEDQQQWQLTTVH